MGSRHSSIEMSALMDDLVSLKYPEEIFNAIIVNMHVPQLTERFSIKESPITSYWDAI